MRYFHKLTNEDRVLQQTNQNEMKCYSKLTNEDEVLQQTNQ